MLQIISSFDNVKETVDAGRCMLESESIDARRSFFYLFACFACLICVLCLLAFLALRALLCLFVCLLACLVDVDKMLAVVGEARSISNLWSLFQKRM